MYLRSGQCYLLSCLAIANSLLCIHTRVPPNTPCCILDADITNFGDFAGIVHRICSVTALLWLMKMATFVYCDLQVIFQRSPILKKQYTHHIVQFAVKSTIQYSRSRGTCGKFLMEALHPIQFTLRALHTYSISYTLADMKFLNNFHDPIFGQKNVTQEKPGIATFFYSQ